MTESSQMGHTPLLVEIRYFAAARDDWELLLLRARQLGVDTIAARVPWAWHAPTERAFDLDGATDERRDLVGFVRLCGRLGLHVLLHPGPLHGNLLGGGVPAWLLQQHPAACALDQDGAPWRDAGGLPHPSALHPMFLAAARDWIAAFSAAMRASRPQMAQSSRCMLAPAALPTGSIIIRPPLHIQTRRILCRKRAARSRPGTPTQLPQPRSTGCARKAGA